MLRRRATTAAPVAALVGAGAVTGTTRGGGHHSASLPAIIPVPMLLVPKMCGNVKVTIVSEMATQTDSTAATVPHTSSPAAEGSNGQWSMLKRRRRSPSPMKRITERVQDSSRGLLDRFFKATKQRGRRRLRQCSAVMVMKEEKEKQHHCVDEQSASCVQLKRYHLRASQRPLTASSTTTITTAAADPATCAPPALRSCAAAPLPLQRLTVLSADGDVVNLLLRRSESSGQFGISVACDALGNVKIIRVKDRQLSAQQLLQFPRILRIDGMPCANFTNEKLVEFLQSKQQVELLLCRDNIIME